MQYKPLHGHQPSDLSKHKTFYGLSVAYETQLRHIACMGDGRFIQDFDGRPEGKSTLGRPRHRWKDNIEKDIKVGRGGMNWIDLAQDRDR